MSRQEDLHVSQLLKWEPRNLLHGTRRKGGTAGLGDLGWSSGPGCAKGGWHQTSRCLKVGGMMLFPEGCRCNTN